MIFQRSAGLCTCCTCANAFLGNSQFDRKIEPCETPKNMALDLFIAKAHPPIGEYPLGNLGPFIHLFFFIVHKIDLFLVIDLSCKYPAVLDRIICYYYAKLKSNVLIFDCLITNFY